MGLMDLSLVDVLFSFLPVSPEKDVIHDIMDVKAQKGFRYDLWPLLFAKGSNGFIIAP
jgi:hypothetical protein